MSVLSAIKGKGNGKKYYSLKLFIVSTVGVEKELSSLYGISSVATINCLNKIPSAKLTLLDGNVSKQIFEGSDGNDFIPGNQVRIKIRYDELEETLFEGIIIKQRVKQTEEGSTQLCLDLKDVAIRLTAQRKNKIFKDKTDVEILKTILEEYTKPSSGIKKVTVPTEMDSSRVQKHREMVQYFVSDWDFIVSRADAIGRVVYVDNGAIQIAEPDYKQQPLTELGFGGNMYQFDLELSAVGQYEKVTARSFNSFDRKIVSEEVGNAISTDQGSLSDSDLSKVLGVENFPMQHAGNLGDPELKAWAYSKLMRSKLDRIKGTIKIDGWAKVKPGVLVDMEKISNKFNGIAFVSGVMNQFTTSSGWYTELQIGFDQEWFTEMYNDIVQEPASGLVPSVNGLVIGNVISVDTEAENDTNYWVKVLIPLLNNSEEGVWARVSGVGLGEKKGVYFKPEVGDDVVLGFLNDDPRQPVVLGTLYSHLSPPEKTTEEDENDQKIKGFFARNDFSIFFDENTDTVTIETPKKQKILISDKEDSSTAYIRMEDANGNSITMDKDGITIYSEKDLTFEAKKNINLKGVNVSNTCSGSFEATGRSGAKLEASGGNTEVKGTLVMIN
jgi:Rhs element Vgr protein